jgi:hypothetical protein
MYSLRRASGRLLPSSLRLLPRSDYSAKILGPFLPAIPRLWLSAPTGKPRVNHLLTPA